MLPPPAMTEAKTASPDKKAQPLSEAVEKLLPIEEIAEKIHLKRILTKNEVNAISIALSREASDSKSKCGNRLTDDVELNEPQNATKIGDLLQLAYFVILNIQPFSQGNNFLGKPFSLMCVF